MDIHNTHCCGIQELGTIAAHFQRGYGMLRDIKDLDACGTEALVAFCRQSIQTKPKYRHLTMHDSALSSFYFFTAKVNGDDPDTYGHRFAKFLTDNNLGYVWESPRKQNAAYYSFEKDHNVQVWVWSPNTKAVHDWWDKWQKANPPKPVVVASTSSTMEVKVNAAVVTG